MSTQVTVKLTMSEATALHRLAVAACEHENAPDLRMLFRAKNTLGVAIQRRAREIARFR